MKFTKAYLVKHSTWVIGICALLVWASMAYLDQIIFLHFKKTDSEPIRYYAREITNIGLSGHYLVIALIIITAHRYVLPKLKKNKFSTSMAFELKEWAWFIIKSILIIGIPLNLLKFSFGRQRPHVESDFNNMVFDFFNLNQHYHSFPSGHSQVLFSLATMAYLKWPQKSYLFFLLAIPLAFTRAAIEQHWLSDVIAGSCLGYIGVLWVYHYWGPKKI